MGSTWSFGPRVRSHKKAIAIGLLIGLLVAASVAVASWLTSGTGPGYSKARSLQLLSLPGATADEVPATLYPGQSGDLTLRVVNPNAALVISGISQTGAFTSDNAGCAASNVSFTAQPDGSLSIPLPAGPSLVSIPGVVSMASDAPSFCQGTLFAGSFEVLARTT